MNSFSLCSAAAAFADRLISRCVIDLMIFPSISFVIHMDV